MLINNDTIIKDTNPLLREKSLDVDLPLSKEDEELLMDMLTYVKESTDEKIAEEKNLRPAVGISAIQIGVKKKLTAIALRDEDGNFMYEYALANPRIVSYSIEKAYLNTGEGCLSVNEEHEGFIHRSRRIKVKAYDALSKKVVILKLSGYLSIIFQHELDHFKGILFYDHINSKDPFYIEENSQIIE